MSPLNMTREQKKELRELDKRERQLKKQYSQAHVTFRKESAAALKRRSVVCRAVDKSFADGSKTYARLQELAGMIKLRKFYEPETTWKARFADGKELRALAAEVLGDAAPSFITACVQRDRNGIPKNKITVDWSRAKDNDAVGEGAA